MSKTPNQFSTIMPRLQLFWDATSLRELMFCPRNYFYRIIQGRQHSRIELEFGIRYHSAMEVYDKARVRGATRAIAQIAAMREALMSAKNKDGTWWSGEYRAVWRCTHKPRGGQDLPSAIKSPLGKAYDKRRCSYAKVLHDGPHPSVCGECGCSIEDLNIWVSEEPKRDRFALIRAVVWAIEEEPEDFAKAVQPYVFEDGTEAVELSFRIPLDMKAVTGEAFWLCGYMDGLATFGAENFVRERKSTKSTLGRRFFEGFSPHIGVDLYDLAASILYPDLDIQGTLLEGTQLMVGGSRTQRQPLYRTERMREELLREIKEYWLPLAQEHVEKDDWPMNRAACWICSFKDICSKDPNKRERMLEELEQRFWNPLEER